MKLYVGNLPFRASESDVQEWFSQAGIPVDIVTVVRDRISGDPRGFGFVEIQRREDAERALISCNGRDFLGRSVVINEARPMASAEDGGTASQRRGRSAPERGRRRAG
ncbi:MAG: RNA-binding protein [Bryobacteraceae bacterium]